MYKTLMLLLVLLVSAAWMQAQSSPQAAPAQSAGDTSEMTVQGCLSGSSGSYTLTADNGTTYQLTGNTAELKDHVGHEVEITGKSSAAASTSTGASQPGSLEVKSMKHISKTCKSAGK